MKKLLLALIVLSFAVIASADTVVVEKGIEADEIKITTTTIQNIPLTDLTKQREYLLKLKAERETWLQGVIDEIAKIEDLILQAKALGVKETKVN